jgi:hypothetical protein
MSGFLLIVGRRSWGSAIYESLSAAMQHTHMTLGIAMTLYRYIEVAASVQLLDLEVHQPKLVRKRR